MKYLFLFLAAMLSFTITAQNSSRTVSESTDRESYTFYVKLDKGKRDVMLKAFEMLRGEPLTLRVTGTILEEHDNGVTFQLDTRKNKLTVNHDGTNEDGREEALALVKKVKDYLDIDSPRPPAPPKRG